VLLLRRDVATAAAASRRSSRQEHGAHDPLEVAMIVIASLMVLAGAIFLIPREIGAAAAPSAAAQPLTKN